LSARETVEGLTFKKVAKSLIVIGFMSTSMPFF